MAIRLVRRALIAARRSDFPATAVQRAGPRSQMAIVYRKVHFRAKTSMRPWTARNRANSDKKILRGQSRSWGQHL
jgi:hypothetical protein